MVSTIPWAGTPRLKAQCRTTLQEALGLGSGLWCFRVWALWGCWLFWGFEGPELGFRCKARNNGPFLSGPSFSDPENNPYSGKEFTDQGSIFGDWEGPFASNSGPQDNLTSHTARGPTLGGTLALNPKPPNPKPYEP